jgi:hypothetical protein
MVALEAVPLMAALSAKALLAAMIGSQESLFLWFVSRICGQRLAPVIFPVRDTEQVR